MRNAVIIIAILVATELFGISLLIPKNPVRTNSPKAEIAVGWKLPPDAQATGVRVTAAKEDGSLVASVESGLTDNLTIRSNLAVGSNYLVTAYSLSAGGNVSTNNETISAMAVLPPSRPTLYSGIASKWFSWENVFGRTNYLQFSTNLGLGTWQNIRSYYGVTQTCYFEFTNFSSAQYYRVYISPQ